MAMITIVEGYTAEKVYCPRRSTNSTGAAQWEIKVERTEVQRKKGTAIKEGHGECSSILFQHLKAKGLLHILEVWCSWGFWKALIAPTKDCLRRHSRNISIA